MNATEFFLGRSAAPPAHADFWYQAAPTQVTNAGVRVTPESALLLSTVYRCVTLISGRLSTLPLHIFERTGPRSRARTESHPLNDLLSARYARPNPWQTSQEFREMLTGHLLLRGNAYAEIVPGRRGPVDQLVPLHPSRVTPEQLEDGSIGYEVRGESGEPKRRLLEDEVLHLRSWAHDGLEGMSPIEAAKQGIGLGLATETHGSRWFGSGARPGGVLKTDKKVLEPTEKRIRQSWKNAHGGVYNSNEVAVLSEGLEWQQIGVSMEDSQFLGTRSFQVADVGGRIYGVPLFLLFEQEKSTSWGTGLAQQSLAFLVYTLTNWLCRWEAGVDSRLILNPRRFFAEHVVDALLNVDVETRNKAFAVALQWGWLSINEVRRAINMNPIPGGDVHLVPSTHQTLERASAPPEPVPAQLSAAPEPSSERDQAVVAYLFADAHGRVLRAECRELTRKLRNVEPDEQSAAIREFYRKHESFAAQTFEPALRARELLLHENGLSASDLAQTIAAAAQKQLVDSGDPLALLAQWEEKGRLTDMLLVEPVERG